VASFLSELTVTGGGSVHFRGLRVSVRIGLILFGRPFVKRFALCYRTDVLSVCSVGNVGVLCPNGWMDQDATWHTEVGLGSGDIVLDGNLFPPPRKGAQQPSHTFRPTLLWHGRPSQQRLNSCYLFLCWQYLRSK